eukprot:10776697-Heterocapsa_arctica.AAC.1
MDATLDPLDRLVLVGLYHDGVAVDLLHEDSEGDGESVQGVAGFDVVAGQRAVVLKKGFGPRLVVVEEFLAFDRAVRVGLDCALNAVD